MVLKFEIIIIIKFKATDLFTNEKTGRKSNTINIFQKFLSLSQAFVPKDFHNHK